MTEEEGKRLAFHEAAHAVVAHALGHKVERITIAPTAQNEGSVGISYSPNLDPRDKAIISYASFFGEKRSKVDAPDTEDHCGSDHEKGNTILWELYPTLESYCIAMGNASSRAEALLCEHRESLEALASALQARTTLDEPGEISAILDRN